jgi:ABC-type spermidine/putrescine transport system permease subunit I
MSLLKFPPNTASGYTFSHYVDVLTNPLNLKIAWTTFWIATTAMTIMLAISIPLAYYMVFRAGRWELFLLLSLVLADELAPVVKIYAWQVILGRNGILNWLIPGRRARGCCSAPSRSS